MDEHLERHQIAGDENDQQSRIAAELVFRQREPGHASRGDGSCNGASRHQHAIEDKTQHAGVGQYRREISERDFTRPTPKISSAEISWLNEAMLLPRP